MVIKIRMDKRDAIATAFISQFQKKFQGILLKIEFLIYFSLKNFNTED